MPTCITLCTVPGLLPHPQGQAFLSLSLCCRTIRPNSAVRSIYKASGCSSNPNRHVNYLEHVVVRITITHPRRGDLAIYLTSPSGTRSQLLANRYSKDLCPQQRTNTEQIPNQKSLILTSSSDVCLFSNSSQFQPILVHF